MSGISRLVVLTLLSFGAALACEVPVGQDADHPPLEWEGERVSVGAEMLDEICVGTLAWLDASVESIEAELELEPSEEKIEFVLVEPEVVEALCGKAKACFSRGMVYSSPSGFDYARHELVHARLDQLGIWGEPLFYEGIAAALDKDGGCLASETCSTANLDALLLASKSLELADIAGLTPGADLVHGLLVTHGPAAVLGFMAELKQDTPPDEVRSLYLEHFGSILDEDFQMFMRGPFDDYTIAQRGCDSLVPVASADDDGVVSLSSAMDCSSPEVVNIINDSSRGEITWTFLVTPEQSGAFSLTWSPMEPDGLLELEVCAPPGYGPPQLEQSGVYTFKWTWSTEETTVVLAPGQYSLRWIAGFGSTLDLELAPPCIFETGGCPFGEQCTIWNECVPEVESPAPIGAPCEQQAEGPLVCEAGSRCLGGVCVAECDSTRPCADGQACGRIRVCGATCDLLAQDCEPGFACLPTGDDNPLNANGIGVCIAVGDEEFLGNCDPTTNECGSGLSCEGVPAPGDSECMMEKGGGCCVPYCDVTAESPQCPDEMPTCQPIRDGPVGICQWP